MCHGQPASFDTFLLTYLYFTVKIITREQRITINMWCWLTVIIFKFYIELLFFKLVIIINVLRHEQVQDYMNAKFVA